MQRVHRSARGVAGALSLGLALVVAPGCAKTQSTGTAPAAPGAPGAAAPAAALSPLSANDVSWLFPAPQTKDDLAQRIKVADIMVPDPANPQAQVPAWTDADFANFLALADNASGVAGPPAAKIGLPPGARDKAAWFVAGVRIDAGAPGLDPATLAAFGQRPQIRLILQPVITNPDGTIKVLDTAAHLIFDYTTAEALNPNCPLHATADMPAFKAIVGDAAALRTSLADGKFGTGTKVSTANLPLGVHPGLAEPKTMAEVTAQMKAILQHRLSPARMNSMAIMSLPTPPAPAPWIFLSMLRGQDKLFHPVPGPTLDSGPTPDKFQFAMMLTGGGNQQVLPAPHTNNQNPITCRSGALTNPPFASPPFAANLFLPVAERKGVTTATVINSSDPAAINAVADVIADPTKSHFFNTDCVSCHTETRLAIKAKKLPSLPTGATPPIFPGLSNDVLPRGSYDVRNFGWSTDGKPVRGGVTRRTANETAAVVAWINANALK